MKTRNSTPNIWLIALAFTVVIPLVAGTFGCANRIGELSSANVSWILMCSAIPMIMTGLMNSIVVGVGRHFRRTDGQLIGILFLTSIPSFIFTFYVVDDVSGI